MPAHDYNDSPLEIWIRKKHMKTNDFLKLVGCSRPVLWKAKKGLPISEHYAKKIFDATKGEVMPFHAPKGEVRL